MNEDYWTQEARRLAKSAIFWSNVSIALSALAFIAVLWMTFG